MQFLHLHFRHPEKRYKFPLWINSKQYQEVVIQDGK